MRVALAARPVDKDDEFLRHKTTRRTVYTKAKSQRPDVDDVLLWNENGEVTETTIGNIVFDFEGRLVTPPIRAGLLPGLMRALLLENGQVQEMTVHKGDIDSARFVYIVNSVRKWMPVQIVD